MSVGIVGHNVSACDFGEMEVVNAPTTANVDIAVIIDSSGSMTGTDPDDKRKEGASLLIEAGLDGDQLAVVEFDSDATVPGPLAALPAGRASLLAAVDSIDSSGNTDIGDGIEAAYGQLDGSSSVYPKAAILLTDGKQTSGAYLDEHLQFSDRKWPIYTIGLSGEADQALLETIAADTGGEFAYLEAPDDLTGIYLTIRSKILETDPALDTSASVAPQAMTTLAASVPPGFLQMSWLSYWGGSTVDMTLVSPSGATFTCENATRVTCVEGATYELITLKLPVAGTWTIELFGTDVPAGGEEVSVIVTGIPAILPPGGTFNDDDGNVHEGNIEAIAEEGVTKGCNPPTNDEYCPVSGVTRGQMAAFLTRALNLPAGSGNTFTDDDGSIFEQDIEVLAAAGITKGCNPPNNDRFCPDEPVTRGQMAAFLVRAFGYTDAGGGNLFVDDDNSIFQADIDKLGTAGVTKGCNPPDNTRFCPDDPVRRDQMASFLARALQVTPLMPPPR